MVHASANLAEREVRPTVQSKSDSPEAELPPVTGRVKWFDATRGFGSRRLDEKLRHAGVGEEDGIAAREHAGAQAVDAALRFAERRRIGPFASAIPDPKQREKALAAMVRAGHPFGLARAIVGLGPGEQMDQEELREKSGLDP